MSSRTYGYALTASMFAFMAMCSVTVVHVLDTNEGWWAQAHAVAIIASYTFLFKMTMVALVWLRKREIGREWDGR